MDLVRGLVVVVALAGCRYNFDLRRDAGDGDADRGDASGDGLATDAFVADVVVATLCPNAVLVGPGLAPSIAWNGSSYGIAYLEGSAIRFAPVSNAGVPGSPVLVATGGSGFDRPLSTSIAWTGGEFAIVHDGAPGIGGVTCGADGTVITAATVLDTASNSGRPRFASGGGSPRLSWTQYLSMDFQVVTTPVTSTLTGITTSAMSNSSWGAGNAAGVWTGSEWGYVWDDAKFTTGCVAHGIWSGQVQANGSTSGNANESYRTNCNNSGNTESRAPLPVWNGNDLSVAWYGTDAIQDIVVARMGINGALVTQPRATTSSPGRNPDITWNGSRLAIAWNSVGVFITEAQSDGTPIGEIVIDQIGANPAIVWDGSRYAVAYERNGSVYFARTCP
jgi:hypothetical protein